MKNKIYYSKGYLVEKLKTNSSLQIAKENDVGINTIWRAKKRWGLANDLKSWSIRDTNILIRNYPLNPIVYKLFPDRTKSSINHKAHVLRLKRIQRTGKYIVDYNFFNKLSPESAYVFGFLCSDGNVDREGFGFSFHISSKDSEILKKIKKLLKSNNPLEFYKDGSVYLRIHNKYMVKRLISLGCYPKKSLTMDFPKIDDKHLSHFVRGYFDGDGCISFNKPNTIKIKLVGTYKFLIRLQDKLFIKLGLRRHKITFYRSIYCLQYYGDDARKFCSWIYKNSKHLFLDRKHNRYINHMRLRLQYG